VDELVRQGREAIDAYDYELARSLLERAFALARGDASTAHALLTLLVDHLAADEEALELAERLAREVLRSSEVRVLLALAAARSGKTQQARSFVAGVEGAPAADVLVILATRALEAGDADEATQLVEEARKLCPAHPGARDLGIEVARVRGETRKVLEDDVTRALGQGKQEEAARLAEALLARFPESEVARRAARAAADQRRTDEAKRFVHEAEEALARGELDMALHWLRRAEGVLGTAPGRNAIAAHIAMLEADVEERALTAKIEEICALLAGSDRRQGLSRYVALNDEARSRVRRADACPLLDPLERMLSRRIDGDDAVRAVVELTEAIEIGEQDPEAALARIAPHERALAGVAEAARLEARMRQQIEAQRQRRVTEIVAAARLALDAGDARRAINILGRLDSREVRAAERESAEALRRAAAAVLEQRELEETYERLRLSDPFAAREVAERLLGREGVDRSRWQAASSWAQAEIRRSFGVWVSEIPAREVPPEHCTPSTVDIGAPAQVGFHWDEPLRWLDGEARALVLTESHDRWLFVRVVDLGTGSLRTRAILRTPEPLDDGVATVMRAGTLAIAGGKGAVLEISLSSWDPVFWRASRDVAPQDEIVEHVAIAPETHFVWIHSRRPDEGGRIRVVDAERRRVVREVSEGWWFQTLYTAETPLVACSRRDTLLSLHHPRGAVVPRGSLKLPADVRAVAMHPSGAGLMAVVGMDDESLGYVEIDPSGRSTAPVWFDGVNPWRSFVWATSLARKSTYLVAHDEEGGVELRGFGYENGSVRCRFQASLPRFAALVQDPSSRHVLALFTDGDRLHLVPLGDEPPPLPSLSAEPERVPALDDGLHCAFSGELADEIKAAIRGLEEASSRTILERVLRFAHATSSAPASILDLYHSLGRVLRRRFGELILSWMRENLPSDPHTALLGAVVGRRAGSLSDVLAALEGIDLRTIDVGHRQHAYHLLGLALLAAGESERAAAVISEGLRESEGSCKLRELLDLAVSLPESEAAFADSSAIMQLRMAVRSADACLSRGDVEGARAAIDRPVVWRAEEVQSLSRLAEAYLQWEPTDGAWQFRKALALARFLDAERSDVPIRKELIFPGVMWPATRLADVEKRAQAWLDALGRDETSRAG
jgi:hypothetical protein